ncbi:MAG: hypothetical protein Q4D98_13085 [Planctomycetia bacterium]|nr:hypothetical protein [Planctomycetia bacterium]
MDDLFPEEIRLLFQKVRCTIRRYACVDGLSILATHWGLLFWVSLLADWFFEPTVTTRLILGGGMVLLLGGDVWYFLIRPWGYPLRDHTIAILLERRFPELGDTLLTVLEPDVREDSPYRRQLFEQTRQKLRDVISEVRWRCLFRFGPLGKHLGVAVLAVASVGAYAAACPESFHLWGNRVFRLSEEGWPRTFLLEVSGFPDGVCKVARGSDLELRAVVTLAHPEKGASQFDRLRTVYLDYREADGLRNRAAMVREGEIAADSQGGRLDFTHTFRGVLTSFVLHVYAGDASRTGLRVEVVDSPTVANLRLALRYPKYMDRASQTIPVSGVVPVPEGTTVEIQAEANKPLVSVGVFRQRESEREPVAEIPVGGAARRFTWTVPELAEDTVLFFVLRDTDGLESRVPTKLALAAVEDALPEVAVTVHGIGTAVTPNARIPMLGNVTDDHGLAKVAFDYRLERLSEDKTGAEPKYQEILTCEGNPTEVRLNGEPPGVLELEGLALREKDRIQVSVVAQDRYDLKKEAPMRMGASRPVTLDVVSPERLRLMVEAREVILRQLYEAIRQEVLDSRDALRDVAAKAENVEETGEKAEEGSPVGLQSYRVERVLQNNRKNVHELLGIVEGIENCVGQIRNNRIDTPAWIERLDAGIRRPLAEVCGEAFPKLELTLTNLRKAIEADDAGVESLHVQALRETDEIVLVLDAVLDKMTEMQDFNEMVETLRGILRSQEELRESVKKKNRQGLLD